MLIVEAVLETFDVAEFTLWPVADLPAYRFLALSGRLSPKEIGTAMASLAVYSSEDSDRATDSVGLVRQLIEAECVTGLGGVRLRDTETGVVVAPGCCCGLEDWRDWLDIMDGGEPWLGDWPAPRVEHSGPVVQLWPADGRSGLCTAPQAIEIPLVTLPDVLQTVRNDLSGFLVVVRQWADRYAPALARDLIAKLDEGLAISAPLRSRQS
ncbi:hypothetical protein [Streptomyces sp. NPDC002187]|uniref:hypothetical protein n=1 Tax=Streptomyces sp. NPDC002187 TaxID=3364637 RepID=UPI0036B44FDB